MFLLGMTGLLQMTVLPGWLWLRAAGIQTQNRIEEGVFCFASSLIFNYWLVYFLQVLGQNNRIAWLGIIAVEVGLLLFVLRPWEWRLSLVNVPPSDVFREAPSMTSVGLAALAAVTLLVFAPILVRNWGTVFISNDDVASFDRFAQDWFHNLSPRGSELYPQMLAANWSITYALMQNTEVKMFAKAIMPFFAAAIPLLLISLAWNRRDRVYMAGSFIAGFLLLQYLGGDFLMTGYVDVALAFYCFLALYVLYQEHSAPSEQARFLAVFFATGAALTKQGGLIPLAAISIYLLITRRNGGREPRASATLRRYNIFAVAFVVILFVPKFYFALQGKSNLAYLLGDIHEGRGYLERIAYGCKLLIVAGGNHGVFLFVVGVALAVAGIIFSETRILTLGIFLPLFLLWGVFFSYELRTGALIIPVAALVYCLTLRNIGNFVLKPVKRLPIFGGPIAYWVASLLLLMTGVAMLYSGEASTQVDASYAWPLVIAGACTALLPAVQVIRRGRVNLSVPALAAGFALLIGAAAQPGYPDDRLLQQQLAAQRVMGSPAVDARLYRLRDSGNLTRPVISNYWYLFSLPELRSQARLLVCPHDCPVPVLLADIAKAEDAGFILLENDFLPGRTATEIAHCNGLEPVFVEGTVSLFRINRPQLGQDCHVDPEAIRPVIEKLFPDETPAGHGFNVQPDGSAAIAVQCRNASRSDVVIWAGTRLDSVYGGPTSVTATVPSRLFEKPGRYTIEVLDTAMNLRSPIAYFDVK